jgi:hypothetical protein
MSIGRKRLSGGVLGLALSASSFVPTMGCGVIDLVVEDGVGGESESAEESGSGDAATESSTDGVSGGDGDGDGDFTDDSDDSSDSDGDESSESSSGGDTAAMIDEDWADAEHP